METPTPKDAPRTERPPSPEARKRFAAPQLTRYDRLPAITGDASFEFPDFPKP